jgi:hypothetical protein
MYGTAPVSEQPASKLMRVRDVAPTHTIDFQHVQIRQHAKCTRHTTIQQCIVIKVSDQATSHTDRDTRVHSVYNSTSDVIMPIPGGIVPDKLFLSKSLNTRQLW